jgi:hypothetical protein
VYFFVLECVLCYSLLSQWKSFYSELRKQTVSVGAAKFPALTDTELQTNWKPLPSLHQAKNEKLCEVANRVVYKNIENINFFNRKIQTQY